MEQAIKRKKRVRAKLSGSSKRPRLSVFRSNKAIYAQFIDDAKSVTLFSLSDKALKKKAKGKTKTEKAYMVGEEIAKKAKAKGIRSVVFDRSAYKYHGRVKAVAEGARKGGLKF